MSVRAMNFKMDEAIITDVREVAEAYHMTITELIREAVLDKLAELKSDPFYRLTVNVKDASAEESEEVLAEIDALSDDDLSIASTKRFTL